MTQTLRFHAAARLPGGDGDVLARAAQPRTLFPAAAAAALQASGAATDNLKQLQAGALVVTTGQQAGLFTGPLFSVLKGLTAAALADALTKQLSRPVVPLYWVAGDDHDFAEINNCFVLSTEGKPERLVLRERPADAPMLPAWREPVGADGTAALARLESLLPPSDFRTTTLEWLSRAYAPQHSMAEAYTLAMAELLGRFGVIVARGWHPAIKNAGRSVMLAALRDAGALERALDAHTERLKAEGRDAPVDLGQGLTLLMLEGASGRDRLRVAGEGRYSARRGHEELSLADLERIAEREPERLSPNVLLRPVVEAAVFPTVAYVAGPGELAYLAQAVPLYEALGVKRQAFVPRVSGAFIEAKVEKVLERYGLSPADLAGPQAALAARVARDDLPAEMVAALATLREDLARGYAALREAAMGVERTMEKPVESARNQALMGIQEIEKKLVAALARRNDTALQQLARARDALFPTGAPQERVLTAASFLSRHGNETLDLAYAAASSHAASLVAAAPRS